MAAYYRLMNGHDDRLRALLRQWRDIEPPANFEANVRRRIRLTQSEEPERITWAAAWQRLLWRPSLAVAVAVVVSASVSFWAKPAGPARMELGFLSAGTLTGGYLQATAKEAR